MRARNFGQLFYNIQYRRCLPRRRGLRVRAVWDIVGGGYGGGGGGWDPFDPERWLGDGEDW